LQVSTQSSNFLAGVFSEVKEDKFYANGVYRVDAQATETMLNSLMYRLCYYRYGEMYTRQGEATGYDSVRNAVIGLKNFKLTYFEEAYTSERWLVRIYKVVPFAEMTPAYETKHPQASKAMPFV
jgi:dolichyl-diphosphooligosaccharide--protein glycosyltransferase